MTNDLKLVSGHLTRFWPAAISSPWLAGWSGGLSTSRRPQHPLPPTPPPFLLLLLFSAPCSQWQQQSQRGRGPLRRTRGGNRWKNHPSFSSLSPIWGRQVFLDFRPHHHSLLITSQPSHCSYRIVSKRQKPPWPKK